MAINFGAPAAEAPRKRDPMDPAPLKAQFARFIAEFEDMAALADGVEVVDDDSNRRAVAMIGQVKQVLKAIETRRKDVTEPYLKIKATVDGYCRELADHGKRIEYVLGEKIRPYMMLQEAKRREAAERARKEAARLQEAAEAQTRAEAQARAIEAAAKGQDAPLPEPPVPVYVAEAPRPVETRTESGAAKLKTEWAWELIDVRLLPAAIIESRMADISKAVAPAINANIKMGVRDIPGVRIFEQTVLKTRAAR
jgi:hypothetical protein